MGELAGYVGTGVISLAVGYALTLLQPTARIVYWSPHSFLFNLTRERVQLQTDALTVQNLGRKPAESVQVVMTHRPDFFQFAPARPYEEETTEEGHFVLTVSTLGPKEFFTLQLLSYTRVPQLLNLRSTAGTAEPIALQLQRVFPKWFNALAAIAFLAGLSVLIYWGIRLLAFVGRGIGLL